MSHLLPHSISVSGLNSFLLKRKEIILVQSQLRQELRRAATGIPQIGMYSVHTYLVTK